MTLKGVAQTVRDMIRGFGVTGQEAVREENIVKSFEDDPEFGLPDRLEALAKEYDGMPVHQLMTLDLTPQDIARRLREVRRAGRCPTCGLLPAPVVAKNERFTATIESAFGERFCEGHKEGP